MKEIRQRSGYMFGCCWSKNNMPLHVVLFFRFYMVVISSFLHHQILPEKQCNYIFLLYSESKSNVANLQQYSSSS